MAKEEISQISKDLYKKIKIYEENSKNSLLILEKAKNVLLNDKENYCEAFKSILGIYENNERITASEFELSSILENLNGFFLDNDNMEIEEVSHQDNQKNFIKILNFYLCFQKKIPGKGY